MIKKICSLTLSLLALGTLSLHAQIISTFAGTGTAGYTVDGVAASTSGLNQPYGVATDAAGNVYIADNANHRIRKVDYTTGIITTIAGTGTAGYIASQDGGQATAALIQNPRGITIDPAGNVVFSDYGNNRIRKINQTTGIITTIAGIGGIPTYVPGDDGGQATAAHTGYPWGVAYDAAGNLYIADNQNCRVRKVNTSGIITTVAGTGNCFIGGDGGQATDAKVQYPTGVALDGAGNLYIADDGNNRIRKVNTSGIISTIAGSPVYGFTGDGGPSTAAKLYYPRAVAADNLGNVYICDVNNNRIRKIDVFGNIHTYAGNGAMTFGGDGGLPTGASLNQPTGFALDVNHGKYYICDNDNNRIRVINTFLYPYFVGGARQVTTTCNDAPRGLDTLLSITDLDLGQTEMWTPLVLPNNGTLVAAYTAPSAVTPGMVTLTSGLTYTPNAGFTGVDSFTVRVFDGTFYDTTTIVVYPNAGVITGIDSVCNGFRDTLSNVIPGGVWSLSNTTLATISSTGVVLNLTMVGAIDTVRYTVTNSCGVTVAIFPIRLIDTGICQGVGVNDVIRNGDALSIFPNPNEGLFTVNLTAGQKEETQFVITNLVGAKVKKFTASTNAPVDVNMNDQPAGIYFLSASNSHYQYTKKIVVTK